MATENPRVSAVRGPVLFHPGTISIKINELFPEWYRVLSLPILEDRRSGSRRKLDAVASQRTFFFGRALVRFKDVLFASAKKCL